MSMNLIKLARKLVTLQISADEFETHFFNMWQNEGRTGQLTQDSKDIESVRLNFLFLLIVIHRIP